jgi:hypothetical protein
VSDTKSTARRSFNSATLKANTLIRAAEILGGLDELSSYLTVPRANLLAWIAGVGEPPLPPFLLAVDLVLEDSETYGVGARREARRENVEK